MVDIPSDIWEQADDALVAIVADGLGPSDQEQLLALKTHIAQALVRERQQLQADVLSAVANESEDCQRRVFLAIKRATSQ